MSGDWLTTGQVARRLGIPPQRVSDAFHRRYLDCDRCPVISGRRIIPAEYLPNLEAVLRERGWLNAEREVSHAR